MIDSKLRKSGVTVPLKKSFLRYNVSALTATFFDKSFAMFLHYFLLVDELVATPIGMVIGSCISFLLGRNWTFVSKENKISNQGMKFLIIACGNIFLNWLLVMICRDIIGIQAYVISSLVSATLVGLCFSFPMQRYFVYK